MPSRDGMNYAPEIKPDTVVERGEFPFAAVGFDHGHIYGQIRGLVGAGATLKMIYEPSPEKLEPVKDIMEEHNTVVAKSLGEILDDKDVCLVAGAAIPDQRCPIGIQVMRAGKDYFTDKAPFVSLAQLEEARGVAVETQRKYAVFYGERLANEAAWHAGELIADGAIGRVLQVLNLAPHNLAKETRPDWFFQKERYGGILTDIGSHQFEQFLSYAGASDGTITYARVANFGNPDTPGLEDFGEAALTLNTGASAYCRIDWFNPAASRTWGDGRTFVLGDEGYIEIRKYVDVARPQSSGDRIFLVNNHEEVEIDCAGKVGFPYFGRLILDVLNRTDSAMTQEHALKAAELSLKAQEIADKA